MHHLPTRSVPTRRGAFSLIELIVTISIIALLIAILLPALPLAIDSARRVACGSNLKNVGAAVEMYKNDFKEVFPLARYMSNPWLSGLNGDIREEEAEMALPSLPEATDAYMGEDSAAWVCPGDKVIAETPYTDAGGVSRTCGASYTYVFALAGQPYEQTFFATFLERQPVDTPVSYDFDGGTFVIDDRFGGGNVTADFFHATRNVLFADSHVGRYGSDGTAR